MDAAGSPAKANEARGELMRFAAALRSSNELRELYANPAVDEATKLKVTDQLARKMKASDLATKILEVLTSNRRINDIDAVLEGLAFYVNRALGVAVAEVRSAKVLTPEEMDQLTATLAKKTGKKVELDIRTDPKLLGGFVVQIGSEIWDASVAGKISKFRESLA